MDWIWRICLAFAAWWLIKETDIGHVVDNRTSSDALINGSIQALLVTLGTLPLFYKIFPSLSRGKQKSDSERQKMEEPSQKKPATDTKDMSANLSAAQKRKDDEKLYEIVAEEISREQRNEGLWLKAMAETEGDENKTKAKYVEFRIQSLKDERELNSKKRVKTTVETTEDTKSDKIKFEEMTTLDSVIQQLGDLNYRVIRTPPGFTVKEPMGAKVRIETEEKLTNYLKQKRTNKIEAKEQIDLQSVIEALEKLQYKVKKRGTGFAIKEPLGGKTYISTTHQLRDYLKQKKTNL